MRKRSEIKPKPAAPLCSACGEPQQETPSGLVCKNGHGGTESVDATSEQLNQALSESEREEQQARRESIRHSGNHPASWPSANRPHEKPIDERFSRIQEHLFVDDVEATWKRLEDQLRVGEDRSDRGVLLRALDNAETNARLAHRLWMTAKFEQQRYEVVNKIVFAALRDEANRVLQKEKDQKLRSKQITEEDIDGMAAQLYPDEYESQTLRRKKAELMVKSFENLAELWMKRCSALESMLGKSR